MVGQIKQACLHRPIKILHFLTPARIQKCLTQLQNILAFLTINHLQAESRIQQGIFLHVIPVCVIVPCIYSTLIFIVQEAISLHIDTPVVTFEQPLWLKATEIVQTLDLKTVLIIGGFHMMMSFAGSIRMLMNGSRLNAALQTSYGPNSVKQMLSGKNIAMFL